MVVLRQLIIQICLFCRKSFSLSQQFGEDFYIFFAKSNKPIYLCSVIQRFLPIYLEVSEKNRKFAAKCVVQISKTKNL